MTIIGITSARDENNALRPLTDEELPWPSPIWRTHHHVPLMAGFDLDAPAASPPDRYAGDMTLKSWQDDKLDWQHIEKCREVASSVSRIPWPV